jgi:hypothetical protein
MTRWDIINHLIVKNNYRSYLEIGYYKGWSFENVQCLNKTSVDPYPCRTIQQEEAPYGAVLFHDNKTNEQIHKLKSDDYFDKFGTRFDIVFIDGLHEAEQVYRDIVNARRVLNDKGIIVLHDCNPPEYEHTTTGINGCWTGDTYKGYLKFLAETGHVYRTVDTDWGVGIIYPQKAGFWASVPSRWEDFDKNRNHLLKLITPEEFLKLK